MGWISAMTIAVHGVIKFKKKGFNIWTGENAVLPHNVQKHEQSD